MLACQAASMAGACVCVWAMHELGDHQAGISITDAAGWVRATGGQESWADRVRCLLGVQTGGRPELMAAAGGGAACPTIDATAISIEPVKAPIDAPLTLGIDHHRRCCHLLPWLPSGHPQPSHCVSALAWERDEPPSYFNRKGGADGSTLMCCRHVLGIDFTSSIAMPGAQWKIKFMVDMCNARHIVDIVACPPADLAYADCSPAGETVILLTLSLHPYCNAC